MPQTYGTIPALATPVTAEGQLTEDGLRNVLYFVIAGGVHGVFVLGSSGEIYGLSAEQKRRFVEVTVEHVAGRLPVSPGSERDHDAGLHRHCGDGRAGGRGRGSVAAASVLHDAHAARAT